MTTGDAMSFGVPLLLGLLLVACAFPPGFPSAAISRFPVRLIAAHRTAQSKLFGGKLFSIPGATLVTSLRGWIAGEIVCVSILSLSLTLEPSWSNAASCFVVGPASGLLILYLFVRTQARKQTEKIRASLPVVSFLLSLLLDAGMGSHAAFREVARAIPNGPLATEMDEISRSWMMGIPREDALETSRRRVPLEDYHLFLNLISQGERLGVGLSRGLGEHSSNMLEREGYRAEAAAQRAAVKLLFPLLAFIFPAVALIIFSPVVLRIGEIWGG